METSNAGFKRVAVKIGSNVITGGDGSTDTSRILRIVGDIAVLFRSGTDDVFSLCLKSGNTCILKGGSDAIYSNASAVKLIKSVLNFNPEASCTRPHDAAGTHNI